MYRGIDPAMLAGPYDTVFDVGAFRGDFAQACLREWPDCTVHSFEPLLEVVNIAGDRWHWHRVALGDWPRHACMWKSEFVPSSSILEMAQLHRDAFPYTCMVEPVPVEVHRLDSFMQFLHGRALLKLDVQGYELHVLRGAGQALDLFDAVVVETSHAELYHGAPTPAELGEFLEAAGFHHQGTVDVTRAPRTHQVLQTDELWRR